MTDLAPLDAATQAVDLPDDHDEFVARFRYVGQVHSQAKWVIGDMMIHGNRLWPDLIVADAASTGIAQQTIANAARVASKVAPERRRADVPWSVHAEVAHLEPDDQVRLLAAAADNGLSVRSLRAVVQQEDQDRTSTDVGRGAAPDNPGAPIRPDDITPPPPGTGPDSPTAPAPAAPKPGTKRPITVFEVTVPVDQADAARRWLEQFTGPLHDRLSQAGAPGAIIEVR